MATKTSLHALPPPALLGVGGVEDYSSDIPEKYVPSGLKPLDDIILGAVAGELLLIAGNPGQGKTSLAMQWVVAAAQEHGPAAVLSLEMGRRALRNRLVSGMTGIHMQTLRTRQFLGDERARAIEAAEYLASIPLFIDDRTGLDGQKVYDAIMSWKPLGIELAVVDYIQQMAGDNDSRVTSVGDAVRAIKAAAKDADMPVIAISALNRSSNAREDRAPRLGDLRDTSDLEFVSDTVIMLHYPEEDKNEDVRVCDIHVMKQRNGPTGVASVKFNRPATRFEV